MSVGSPSAYRDAAGQSPDRVLEAGEDGNPVCLEVRGLRVGFPGEDGGIGHAVDRVSFTVRRGEVLCLVGESGCGKSVTALSIPRLLPSPPSLPPGADSGEILFEGQDLARLPERDLRRIRGARIGMVFQDPMTSLNPVMRVGEQVVEGLRLHTGISARQARDAAVSLLESVGIPQASRRVDDFPHQMSGGMRQRVMIAMAMACGPSLIIADEPTTALDVTIQRQILALLRSLTKDAANAREEAGGGVLPFAFAGQQRSLLLITHDFGVVGQIADEVAVMYAGVIVEQGQSGDMLREPRHPYTQGLLRSRPSPGGSPAPGRDAPDFSASSPLRRLTTIPGAVPGLWNRPAGCRFHPRCPVAFERCPVEEPPLSALGGGRSCRCWRVGA